VEVAETEEDGPDPWVLVLNFFFVEEYEGSLEILFQALRWLVGQLDCSLKETNWNRSSWIR